MYESTDRWLIWCWLVMINEPLTRICAGGKRTLFTHVFSGHVWIIFRAHVVLPANLGTKHCKSLIKTVKTCWPERGFLITVINSVNFVSHCKKLAA